MNNSEKILNYKTMTMYVCNPDLNKKWKWFKRVTNAVEFSSSWQSMFTSAAC